MSGKENKLRAHIGFDQELSEISHKKLKVAHPV